MSIRVIRHLLRLLDVTAGTPRTGYAPLYDSGTSKAVMREIRRGDVAGHGSIADGAAADRVIRSDSFDRTNSASSLGNPSDGGSAWVQIGSDTSGISANTAYTAGGTDARAYLEASDPNAEIRVVVSVASAGASILFRATDASNHWIAQISGTTLTFQHKTASSSYSTAATASGVALSNGDTFSVKVIGSWLRAYVNDVLKLEHINHRHRSATKHGVRFSSSTTRYSEIEMRSISTTEYFASEGRRFKHVTFHKNEGEDLWMGESDDGINVVNLKPLNATWAYPARDPSLLIDPTDGAWYVFYTNASVQSWPTLAGGDHYSVVRSTDDGATWTDHGTVNVSSVYGTPDDNFTWAPFAFRDDNGSIYLLGAMSDTNPTTFRYGLIPITSLNPLTIGTISFLDVGGTVNVIDPMVVKIGATYRLFGKTDGVAVWWADATALAGPYGAKTNIATAAYEGQFAVARADLDQIWVYIDHYTGSGMQYIVSSDGGATYGALQLMTYDWPLRHGDVVDSLARRSYTIAYSGGIRVLTPDPITSRSRWVQNNFRSIADALAGKASTSHTHAISDVTSLQATLDGKAATSHAHAGEDIISGTVADARLSANIPLLNAANVFQNNQTIAGAPEEGRYFDISYDDAGDLYKVRSEISYSGAYIPRLTVSSPSEATTIESGNIQTPSLSVTGPATALSFAGDGASLTGIRVRPGGMITNKYYGPAGPFSVSTGAATANKLCYELIWVPPGETINRVGIEVTSASSAGTKARIGLYADSNGRPGALLYDWGEVATDANGIKEITISQALGGFYWLACLTQSTPTLRNIISFDCGWLSGRDAPSNTVFNLKETYTYGTLPATATPSLDFSAMPFIFFRKV